MNKLIAASICVIVLLLPSAFADDNVKLITEKKYEVVNVNSFLNIRSGPGTIYSILRAIPSTEKNITIVESKQLAKSTWVKIKHNNEYGWVNQVYLQPSTPDAKKPLEQEGVSEEPLLWLTMSGVYSLTNIAPKKGENMDTHMLFQVESEQAKIIYDAIKTPSFTDKCTGASAKKVGEMLCLHYPTPEEKQDKLTVQTENQEQEEQETKQEDSEFAETSSAVIQDIYECHFSINIMQQKIQQGIPCEK